MVQALKILNIEKGWYQKQQGLPVGTMQCFVRFSGAEAVCSSAMPLLGPDAAVVKNEGGVYSNYMWCVQILCDGNATFENLLTTAVT